MSSNKYFSIFSCLLLIKSLSLSLVFVSARRQTISENEEVHFEVWKERRIKYLDDAIVDSSENSKSILKNLYVKNSEVTSLTDFPNWAKFEFDKELVPKVLIDLLYRNAVNKTLNSDIVVRSYSPKAIDARNSAEIIVHFDLNSDHHYEKFQKAQLILNTNSNSSLTKLNKITGMFMNGVFAKIKLSNGEIILDATSPVKHCLQIRNPYIKIHLQNKRWAEFDQFKMPGRIALLIYTIASPDDHHTSHTEELAELIHHEEQVNLDRKRRIQKRSALLSNEIPNAPIAPADDYEEVEEFSNDINRNLMIGNKLGVHGKQMNAHVRRHLAKKMWGPCRKRPFYVNFAEVKFDSWIIAPKGYQAYECYGRCGYPLGAHLTPTKHAIFRAMLNGISPRKATRACCVPTKLEPTSLLYMDDNGVLTYKYNYDDMIVGNCGCR